MKKNIYMLLGFAIVFLIFVMVAVGQFCLPYDPNQMCMPDKLLAPSLKHFFGTDNFGRDIFCRVAKALSSTVIISSTTILISSLIGISIGAFAGYFGGVADKILVQLNDMLTAFPKILLALIIINFVGSGKYNVVLALSISFIPSFVRVSRGAFLDLRNANYVLNAKLMGANSFRILFIHILPNTVHILVPALIIGFNNAVLAEASTSFLGLGVTPPDISLGYMLSEAQGLLCIAPWYALSVGFVIMIIVFGVGLIGHGLLLTDKR